MRRAAMRPMVGRLSLLVALLAAIACSSEERHATTQVIVEIGADTAVAARVVRIEASVYDAAGDASSTKHMQRFALGSATSSADAIAVSLPFSFAVTQNHAHAVRLEVTGYESWSLDAQPIISSEKVVRFVQGSSLYTSVYLAAPCLDQASLCSASGLTCSPESVVRCVPISDALLSPTVSNDAPAAATPNASDSTVGTVEPMDAAVSAAPSALPHADATEPVATLPSVGLDAATADAQVTELPPVPLPACPVADACPVPAYPCIPSDDGLGYACRGQYATWHMPDAQPDAKYGLSYTVDAAAGTVLDNVTSLLWQRDLPASYAGCTGRTAGTPGDSCTAAEAEHYCSQLSLADQRWRLPTKIELESLIYSIAGTRDAYIDLTAFPKTPYVDFWSASPVLVFGCADCNYQTGFAAGLASGAVRSDAKRVRCVRSTKNFNAPPKARYTVDSENNTVRDNFTNLTWLRGQSTAALSADAARTFCQSKGSDFRVPTHKELLTLAEVTGTQSALDPAFVHESTYWLSWSTSPAFVGGTLLYASNLADSLVSDYATGDLTIHVRCVR